MSDDQPGDEASVGVGITAEEVLVGCGVLAIDIGLGTVIAAGEQDHDQRACGDYLDEPHLRPRLPDRIARSFVLARHSVGRVRVPARRVRPRDRGWHLFLFGWAWPPNGSLADYVAQQRLYLDNNLGRQPARTSHHTSL